MKIKRYTLEQLSKSFKKFTDAEAQSLIGGATDLGDGFVSLNYEEMIQVFGTPSCFPNYIWQGLSLSSTLFGTEGNFVSEDLLSVYDEMMYSDPTNIASIFEGYSFIVYKTDLGPFSSWFDDGSSDVSGGASELPVNPSNYMISYLNYSNVVIDDFIEQYRNYYRPITLEQLSEDIRDFFMSQANSEGLIDEREVSYSFDGSNPSDFTVTLTYNDIIQLYHYSL